MLAYRLWQPYGSSHANCHRNRSYLSLLMGTEADSSGEASMIAMTASLIVGLIAGYAGQRSRFCIISGIRDFFLIRDSYRLKGLIGVVAGAFLGFIIFKALGGAINNFPMKITSESGGYWVASAIGALGMGFFSVLAEGCPFRQHIMLAEGKESARFYLIGFYLGIVFFYSVTIYILELLVTA